MSPHVPAASLAEYYAAQSAKIDQRFEASGDGRAALAARSALVDSLVASLCRDSISAETSGPEGFCLVALGGYGRQELFPHSDVDLLFLSAHGRIEASLKEAVAAVSRALWDLRLRVGHTSRTANECGELHRQNLEFNIALLDCRYLAGDAQLFARLRNQVIPHLVARDRQDLVQDLVQMTLQRHQKHGNTVFHLEPNLKDAPGGLRDYHVARWLALIPELEKSGRWIDPEGAWPEVLRAESTRAFEFLCSVRCFLHTRWKRDDNQVTYELQDLAASLGIGLPTGAKVSSVEWIRTYFRHARSVDRLAAQLLDEAAPARASLYGLFKDWKSRLANADFSVVRGRIFPRQPAAVLQEPDLLLNLFEIIARHGLEPSRQAERWVEQRLPQVAAQVASLPDLGRRISQILVLPHAAPALRAMHRLGVLVTLFPELRAIDALVIRDFFHRYTVDEHSFMAIQHLHELRPARASARADRSAEPANVWDTEFSEIFSELEQPELLFLALLFHDVGKGLPHPSHIQGSLEAVEGILARLALEPEACEAVRYLISNHLEMSATLQRRDIFDPETISAFAKQVGTPERLKMLCVFTYADIKAVNPDALTPWKTEMLWQLYAATSNYLSRSVDEERFHSAGAEAAMAERLLPLLPAFTGPAEINAFLEGFPRRYLLTHSPEEIAAHFQMARRLAAEPVQVSLRARSHLFELTVLTTDRAFLFASISGTLAAWGMSIVKAEAFANAAGTVLDTFRFLDLFRTLELNPSEIERFKKNLVEVLSGKLELPTLMRGRIHPQALPQPKVKVPLQIRFDNQSASHSTLLELIAQDRPGLLYQVSSTLAELRCNIEVALIDTEGQKAIDVFYLTSGGAKLTPQRQKAIQKALHLKLQPAPALQL